MAISKALGDEPVAWAVAEPRAAFALAERELVGDQTRGRKGKKVTGRVVSAAIARTSATGHTQFA